MTHVLDRFAVDALLAAVDGGQVGQDVTASRGLGAQRAAPIAIQVYDFRRPERVSKNSMRALRSLHEGFGRKLGEALSEYLRTLVEVSVAHLEQLPYGEFIHALPSPTCCNRLKAEQLNGPLCLEISPLIIYPIIDRLLGGGNADLFIPQRPLTQIEQRLVQRVTDHAAHHLSEAWSSLTPVTFSVNSFESDPQLVQIVAPDATVIVVGFEMKMGSRVGTMSLCIPHNVIEPIMGVLAARNGCSDPRAGGRDDQLQQMRRHVSNVGMEMRAFLAQTTITANELMTLQVGDVITTDQSSKRDVRVQIEGKIKFVGQLGQLRGRRVVQIARVCPHQEANGRIDSIGGDA